MIDVNSFTTDVKDQILGIHLCHRHQSCLSRNRRSRCYILCLPDTAVVQGSPGWHVGCFLGVYVEGNHRLVGSGRHRRPLAASVCRCIRNHCLTHCVQKGLAAQEVHPWAAAYFFIGD